MKASTASCFALAVVGLVLVGVVASTGDGLIGGLVAPLTIVISGILAGVGMNNLLKERRENRESKKPA